MSELWDILGKLGKQVYKAVGSTFIMLLLNPGIVDKMWPAFIDITLVDVYLNRKNWLHFILLMGGAL